MTTFLNAATQIGFKAPLVMRLEGSNVDAAAKLPTLQAATDLGDAADDSTICLAVTAAGR
ncbi:MAG: hypothetical protein IPJ41_17440 [Phycisphaerales bacterium]|nr:hypothetical protein [Phycisphaerales bacterium]